MTAPAVYLSPPNGRIDWDRLLPALREPLRLRAAALGFKRIYNEAGDRIVNVGVPLVICGQSNVDHNEEDPETMRTLGDLLGIKKT